MAGARFVTAVANGINSGSSVGNAIPSATAGDLLVAICYAGTSSGSWSTPSGWTLYASKYPTDFWPGRTAIFYKYAVANDPGGTFAYSQSGSSLALMMLQFTGAAASSPLSGINFATYNSQVATMTAASESAASGDALLSAFLTLAASSCTAPAAMTQRSSYVLAGNLGTFAFDQEGLAGGSTGSKTTTLNAAAYGTAFSLLVKSANTAPNAPTLTGPAVNATIDESVTQRFSWQFSDPDASDSQSKFDLQWWPLDAPGGSRTGAATTVSSTTPNQFYDFAANYWAAGSYEWQVRTYDSQGVVGPWSGSFFFTAATAPTPPTISAPTSGGTVGSSETVTWSEPSQDSYQIRRVADNGGSADTSTVYYDSGEVVSSTARSATLTFETNNRWEHIQVRIKYNGLWSAWSDIRVDVSYTPPAAPQVTLTPDAANGVLTVGITNPTPGAGQPATSYNNVYVDDGKGAGKERVATNLPTNQPWTYALPVSLRDYTGNLWVEAVGVNGTTAETAA